jgi:hypothetical protein
MSQRTKLADKQRALRLLDEPYGHEHQGAAKHSNADSRLEEAHTPSFLFADGSIKIAKLTIWQQAGGRAHSQIPSSFFQTLLSRSTISILEGEARKHEIVCNADRCNVHEILHTAQTSRIAIMTKSDPLQSFSLLLLRTQSSV